MDEFPEQNTPENTPEQNTKEKKVILAKIPPLVAALIGLFGSFFLYQIVGGGLTLLLFGVNINQAPVNEMRLMTMAGQLLFLLLPALIFTKIIYVDVTEVLRVRPAPVQEIALFSLGIFILTPLLQFFLYIQNYYIAEWAKMYPWVQSAKSFFDSLNEMMDTAYASLLRVNNLIDGILVVLVVAVIPALTEETLFRGYVQRSFEFKMKPFWATLITAVFFGLFHFNPYGLIPLIVLGFYFGFAAYTSNSILVPIVLHFLNNFAAVIFTMFGSEELTKSVPMPQKSELTSYVSMFFIFLLLFLLLIAFIKKYYLKNRTN